MHTDSPFASHCVLGGCAALICNQIFVSRSVHGPWSQWGADDEVLEERWLKNALGRAERTHKSQTAP